MRLLPKIDPADKRALKRRAAFLDDCRLLGAYALAITVAFIVALID